jgi:hypothetical protein
MKKWRKRSRDDHQWLETPATGVIGAQNNHQSLGLNSALKLSSGFLDIDPEVPGSIPRRYHIYEKQSVWNGVHSV